MKDIELRLGLVLYGGVSLAIYMHGVSREILNLVRASSVRQDRRSQPGSGAAEPPALSPSQSAFGDLLDLVSPVANVQVVVDAIAGASAGGVNGIMLARAITHDLPLDSHSTLWLENADVTRLARPQTGLSRYFKMSVSPMLDQLMTTRLSKRIESAETREKLRKFMQSRWFSPPFSGERFIGWMLDACQAMEADADPGRSLIPSGQTLDLFVTLTDYNGVKRRIHLDDPAFVEEWDHRRILNFHASHRAPGYLDSQFDGRCVPELVFAARATSSFPGAFPPATVSEMERVLVGRGEGWSNRDAFLRKELGLDEAATARHCFVDGSVVMNKPFAPVIDVIKDRPATRKVARRLIYVDPSPVEDRGGMARHADTPGFFRVILASLAHIPRNEPIGDDLKELEQNNRRSRWLANLLDMAGPTVDQAVAGLLPKRRPVSADAVAEARHRATIAAFDQAGFAFLNYQSLKLHALSERLARLVADIDWPGGVFPHEEALLARFEDHLRSLTSLSADVLGRSDPAVVAVLRGLDVDYRVRRLRFAIRKLNGFYDRDRSLLVDAPDTEALDRLKALLYEQIDHLSWRWSERFYGGYCKTLAEDLCASDLDKDGGEAVVHRFLSEITRMMGLADLDKLHDDLFAQRAGELLDKERHGELLRAYIGFGYYDLITFPVLQRNDFSEVTEILVDRISPGDALTLHTEGFELKGKQINTFGAFFNRSWREHDYLWGRLHAADRLVSVVLSAAGEGHLSEADINRSRASIFLAILQEERPKLGEIADEIERVDALVRSICPDFAPVSESI